MKKKKDASVLLEMAKETFASFGVELSTESDLDLSNMGRGNRMTRADLEAMPDDSVIFYMWTEFHGGKNRKIKGAYRVRRGVRGSYVLNDGSSFGCDFDIPNNIKSGDPLKWEDDYGENDVCFAVPKVQTPTKTKRRTRSAKD